MAGDLADGSPGCYRVVAVVSEQGAGVRDIRPMGRGAAMSSAVLREDKGSHCVTVCMPGQRL